MPRTATLTENGDGATHDWAAHVDNVEHRDYGGAVTTYVAQKILTTVKVGVVFRVRSNVDWKQQSANKQYGTQKLIIGGDTYTSAEVNPTTSYVTNILNSGNFKTTKRYTQAHVDAMYFEEWDRVVTRKYNIYTTNRTHKVEYCYEHNVGGVAALKLGKIGGLDIGKVWKVGGRSQISGTADIAEV